jgi:hypothetical protein
MAQSPSMQTESSAKGSQSTSTPFEHSAVGPAMITVAIRVGLEGPVP